MNKMIKMIPFLKSISAIKKHLLQFVLALALIAITAEVNAQAWTMYNTGFNFILTDITFPGNQNLIGYAVGESVTYNGTGVILKTTNGGTSWTQMNASTIPGLEAVSFVSVDTGFVGGWQNYFAKTTDGGLTWTTSTVNSNIWYIKQVRFRDSMHGIVTDGSTAYVTANGGTSWTTATGFINAQQVIYVSDSVLFAVGGDEKIAKSVNGGLTWTTVFSGVFQYIFLGVDFYDLDNGIVTGEDGKIKRTSNGGATWTTQQAGSWALLHSAKMHSLTDITVAGTPEAVYETTNGGTQWLSAYSGTNTFALYNMAFTPNGKGFICGSQGRILIKNPVMQADFTASADSVCLGSSVTFTDASTGSPSQWTWSFPGGTPSSHVGATPPSITYSVPGSYDVRLIVTGTAQVDTMLKPNAVTVVDPSPTISGDMQVIQQTQHTYSVPATSTSYTWGVNSGTIVNGSGTPQVDVEWTTPGTGSLWVDVVHPAGCNGSDTIQVTIASNIGLVENGAASYTVYPNPATNKLFVHVLNHDIRFTGYTILDVTGRTVQQGNAVEIIDVSSLATGMYILQLQTDGQTFTQRVELH